MAKPLRIVLASIGVLLGLFAVLLAAEQSTLTYSCRTPSGHGSSSHTTTYAPGVVATVVASLMALVMTGWLVVNAVGVSNR